MKEQYTGNLGFSTIEISIAIAIISIALSGSINANFAGQHWKQIGTIKTTASNINNEHIEDLTHLLENNFYYNNQKESANCDSSGFCYITKQKVTNTSSCSNKLSVSTEWKINSYPTTSVNRISSVYNDNEVINLGGDCLLKTLTGDWSKNINPSGLYENLDAKNFTSFDILNDYIYTTSNTTPTIRVYKILEDDSLLFISSHDIKINDISTKSFDIDVITEIATGRKYAFVAVGGTTNQLAVLDVTDPLTPIQKNQLTLKNVSPTGSFPQGYRIFAYGNRLYLTTRETAGFEFHTFNISSPEFPVEIGNGFELNRTVNEIYVREQKQNNTINKYIFLASDSNLKELAILDVKNDIVSEINTVNLPGNQDGLSLYTSLDKLYFGRANNTSGPELYLFDISDINIPLAILAQSETGSNISSIQQTTDYLFLGTNKTSENFQVWTTNFLEWNNMLNSGRKNFYNFPNLSLLGIEISEDRLILINSSNIVDRLQIIKSNE